MFGTKGITLTNILRRTPSVFTHGQPLKTVSRLFSSGKDPVSKLPTETSDHHQSKVEREPVLDLRSQVKIEPLHTAVKMGGEIELAPAFSQGVKIDFSKLDVRVKVPYFDDITVWPFPHQIEDMNESDIADYIERVNGQPWVDRGEQHPTVQYCANAGNIWLGASKHTRTDGTEVRHRHFLKTTKTPLVGQIGRAHV